MTTAGHSARTGSLRFPSRQTAPRCTSPPTHTAAASWCSTVSAISGARCSSRPAACTSHPPLPATRRASSAVTAQRVGASGVRRRGCAAAASAKARTARTSPARQGSVARNRPYASVPRYWASTAAFRPRAASWPQPRIAALAAISVAQRRRTTSDAAARRGTASSANATPPSAIESATRIAPPRMLSEKSAKACIAAQCGDSTWKRSTFSVTWPSVASTL